MPIPISNTGEVSTVEISKLDFQTLHCTSKIIMTGTYGSLLSVCTDCLDERKPCENCTTDFLPQFSKAFQTLWNNALLQNVHYLLFDCHNAPATEWHPDHLD